MRRKGALKLLVLITAALILVLVFSVVILGALSHEQNPKLGASFSTQYSEYLELDVLEVYSAMLSDFEELEVLRIPVYWNEIEPAVGEYDFETLDILMDLAAENEVRVTLAIGTKVPRWPECFIPLWLTGDTDEFEERFFAMISEVVGRYDEHPALERWQVENEPFFPFGDCPVPDPERFQSTIDLVRSIDSTRLIQSTASGEQAVWFLRTGNIDVLGVSLYREVWNSVLGTFIFPHPPLVYTLQRMIAEPFVDMVVISELQMEPWIPDYIENIESSIAELYDIFPAEDMDANMEFAQQVGASEIYVWGVEWWYFMLVHGESRMWEKGIDIF